MRSAAGSEAHMQPASEPGPRVPWEMGEVGQPSSWWGLRSFHERTSRPTRALCPFRDTGVESKNVSERKLFVHGKAPDSGPARLGGCLWNNQEALLKHPLRSTSVMLCTG